MARSRGKNDMVILSYDIKRQGYCHPALKYEKEKENIR